MAIKDNRNVGVRYKRFALRIINMCGKLPGTPAAKCREAKRARSKKEFISKMRSALQELEETAHWLELLVESGIVNESKLAALQQANDELIAMFVSSIKTASVQQS